MPPKLFSFTQFRKNASATPLVSHTFKTKDLKPFRFTHFQKKGRGWVPLSNLQPHTSNLCSSLTPLDSALTSKRAPKPFRCNTYEKHTQGEGVGGDAPSASPHSIGKGSSASSTSFASSTSQGKLFPC